jgi:hypothetical protein
MSDSSDGETGSGGSVLVDMFIEDVEREAFPGVVMKSYIGMSVG